MPEEHNRRLTDHLSSLLLTPSEDANENLELEGIGGASVVFVGNTMIDTLFANIDVARNLAAWEEFGLTRSGYVLVTLHRPALVDDPTLILSTVAALEEVARDVPVLFPVHPRTRARLAAGGLSPERVQLVDPQPYRRFLSLQSGAAAVVTDSGGIQEETTALGIPCFTLRDEHRAAGDGDAWDERRPRPRPLAVERDPEPAEQAETQGDPAEMGRARGRAGGRRHRGDGSRVLGQVYAVDQWASSGEQATDDRSEPRP